MKLLKWKQNLYLNKGLHSLIDEKDLVGTIYIPKILLFRHIQINFYFFI